jgi:HEAT repeat protein
MTFRIPCWMAVLFVWAAMRAPTAAESPTGTGEVARLISQAAMYEAGQSLAAWRSIETLAARSGTEPALRQELEAGLAQLLITKASPESKRLACQQLVLIGTDSSLPAIATLLKNSNTVETACLALGRRPSAKANEMLRQALTGLQGTARVQVINALGDRQDAQAVPRLSDLARDSDGSVAAAAVTALGKIADKPSLQAIAALRKEGKPELERAVTEASLRGAEKLAAGGDRPGAAAIYEELLQPPQAIHVRRGALRALFQLDPDGGEQRILGILRGSDEALKPVAIAGIIALEAPTASEVFGRELPALRVPDQVLLIEALAGRDDKAARQAISGRLSAKDMQVRLAAISALSTAGDAATVPLLAKALANTTAPEEIQAIDLALSRLGGGQPTDEAIIRELTGAAPQVEIRLMAVLARRGCSLAVPVLLAETKNANPQITAAAFRALGKVAGAEDLATLVDELVQVTSPAARPVAENAVARVMEKVQEVSRRSAIVCHALAQTGDVAARCSLLHLLPSCGDAPAFAALKAAYASSEPNEKEAAVRALAEWPDGAGREMLMALFARTDDSSHHALALRALVRLVEDENAHPNAALWEHYRQLLSGAQSDEDRKLILGALAGSTQPEGLQLALPLLANPAIRPEAELAIRKIAESIKTQHPQEAEEALRQLR